jgi:hypothetical protein
MARWTEPISVGEAAVGSVGVGDAPSEDSLVDVDEADEVDKEAACLASTVAKVHSRNARGVPPVPGIHGWKRGAPARGGHSASVFGL